MTNSDRHNISWAILMIPVIALGVMMAEDGQPWGWLQVGLGSASLTWKLWLIRRGRTPDA